MAEKWKEAEPEFIAYLENVYMNTNTNWYADETPKINDCREVFNRSIDKCCGTEKNVQSAQ